jgi:hypothetical protein
VAAPVGFAGEPADDWPRPRAYELFRPRHERWAPAARAYFESLEDGVIAPGAAA